MRAKRPRHVSPRRHESPVQGRIPYSGRIVGCTAECLNQDRRSLGRLQTLAAVHAQSGGTLRRLPESTLQGPCGQQPDRRSTAHRKQSQLHRLHPYIASSPLIASGLISPVQNPSPIHEVRNVPFWAVVEGYRSAAFVGDRLRVFMR
jgi:hypothetical protein